MKRLASIFTSAAIVAAGLSLVVTSGVSLAASTAAGGPVRASVRSAATLPKITVATTGKKITVGGALQSGAVQIVATVNGEHQGEAVFVRLNPGVPLSRFLKLLQANPDPNSLTGIGSIVTDVAVTRGRASTIQADLK